MKKWFFLSFLALLLIQGSAGATIITETFSVNLTTPPPPYASCPTGKVCSGTGTFTLTVDTSDPTGKSNTLAWLITLSKDENMASLAQANLVHQGTGSFPFNFTAPGVIDVFIGDDNFGPIVEIAQLNLAGAQVIAPFITSDPFTPPDPRTLVINPNPTNNFLSGTMNYDGCSSISGDGTCNFITDPAFLLGCKDYLYVYNDLSHTGLDLRGNICTAAAVPAPGSLSLVGIGLAGLGLLRQRRKQHPPALQPA